jgi:hypothetical protein
VRYTIGRRSKGLPKIETQRDEKKSKEKIARKEKKTKEKRKEETRRRKSKTVYNYI